MPFIVAKVLMQVSPDYATKYATVSGTMKTIVKAKGWNALYFGYSSAIVRSMIFTGARIPLYEGVREKSVN